MQNMGNCLRKVVIRGDELESPEEIHYRARDLYNGNGVDKDPHRAVKLYQQAADQGHLDSVCSLGCCYMYGHGAPQDYCRAADLFERSADISRSLNNLAWVHARKRTPESIKQATICLRQVLKENPMDDYALFSLAEILAASVNAKDLREARMLAKKVSQECDLFYRSQWLLPFIEDQLAILSFERSRWNLEDLRPDFVLDADLHLIALIGLGQFGKVYLAQFQRQKFAAVKLVNIDLVQNDETAARNILRERFTCRILEAHGIKGRVQYIGFVDVYENSRLRGLVFEICADISDVEDDVRCALEKDFVSANYAKIESLPDWSSRVKSSLRCAVVFARVRPWPVSKLVGMLRQVAEALSDMHKLGILHRDIAARNVLCDSDGTVQLADFGLAKLVGSGEEYCSVDVVSYYHTLTPDHQYAVAWWAPECIDRSCEDEEVVFSTNSDVYSFGVLLWQCFAHRDPFDDVKPISDSPEDVVEAAKRIILKILSGERPNLDLLDNDAPDDLALLIEDCFCTDPADRPTMKDIIKRLARIEQQPAARRSASARDAKVHKKWFDVKNMYRSLPLPTLKERAELSSNGGSFTSQSMWKRLAAVRHTVSPSRSLGRTILNQFSPRVPCDIFLINTGTQKNLEADFMVRLFTEARLNCFFDADLNSEDKSPTEAMRFALTTCRHVVAIVSEESLEKQHPRDELVFAFKRMMWLRDQQELCWESVWIVLYDVSTSDYNQAQRKHSELPNLCQELVVYERKKFSRWTQLCDTVKADIIHHDNSKGAVEKWRLFLEQWNQHDETFPRASEVYK